MRRLSWPSPTRLAAWSLAELCGFASTSLNVHVDGAEPAWAPLTGPPRMERGAPASSLPLRGCREGPRRAHYSLRECREGLRRAHCSSSCPEMPACGAEGQLERRGICARAHVYAHADVYTAHTCAHVQTRGGGLLGPRRNHVAHAWRIPGPGQMGRQPFRDPLRSVEIEALGASPDWAKTAEDWKGWGPGKVLSPGSHPPA